MLTQEGFRGGMIRAAALPLLLAGLLLGCADMNDDPAGTMSVSFSFAGDDDSALTDGLSSPSSVASTDPILSVIVGAIVITHDRDPGTSGIDAYTNDVEVTEELKDELKDDAIQSAAYLTIVDLPFGGDTVSFLIPPGAAGLWQLVGVGSRNNIDVLQDLEDQSDSAAWYGFTPEFQNDQINPGDTVDLEIAPGCALEDPPPAPACPAP